jgi:hypothetical protein
MECIICFELIDLEQGNNLKCCQCNVVCHKNCLMKWYIRKGITECPHCSYIHIDCCNQYRKFEFIYTPIKIQKQEHLLQQQQELIHNHKKNILALSCIVSICITSIISLSIWFI